MYSINARFASGEPSSDPDTAGVVYMQFDGRLDEELPWMPPRESEYNDRMGTSILYKAMKKGMKSQYGPMTLRSDKDGGLIFKPGNFEVSCSYFKDSGASRLVQCAKPRPEDCIPGCAVNKNAQWCKPLVEMAQNGHGWCGGNPYKRKDLEGMLELHKSYGEGGPNEVIIDTVNFAENLPEAVEAFFYPDSIKCVEGSKCRDYARTAHATFLRQYDITEDQVPLLVLRLHEWDRPFVKSSAPTPPPVYPSPVEWAPPNPPAWDPFFGDEDVDEELDLDVALDRVEVHDLNWWLHHGRALLNSLGQLGR